MKVVSLHKEIIISDRDIDQFVDELKKTRGKMRGWPYVEKLSINDKRDGKKPLTVTIFSEKDDDEWCTVCGSWESFGCPCGEERQEREREYAEAEKKYMEENPGSLESTFEHKREVSNLIEVIMDELDKRSKKHDDSKTKDPELKIFDEFTPKLKNMEYGSDEYKKCLEEMKPALDHHYKHNRHHPEHFDTGISGMNLIDVIEMFCDWYAASKRTKNGCMEKSIDYSCKRFDMDAQVKGLFINTMIDLGLDK